MTRAAKRAFTLIELMVVIVVLAILAAVITPSLVSMKATSDHRDTVSAVRRLSTEARNLAIARGETVIMVYDDSAKALSLQSTDSEGETNDIKSVPVTPDLEPTAFRNNEVEANSSDFEVKFGPDGHSTGGALQFESYSLIIDNLGNARFVHGELPATGDDKWEAGSLEQRT